jgi:hypothetical protein
VDEVSTAAVQGLSLAGCAKPAKPQKTKNNIMKDDLFRENMPEKKFSAFMCKFLMIWVLLMLR